jgi:N-glycosylase/DNA lyase
VTSFSASYTRRLDGTIRVLCPLIEKEIRDRSTRRLSEYDLRRELIGCILGSQVRYEMAVAATENLEYAGLLDDAYWCGWKDDGFEGYVLEVLIGRSNAPRHGGSYRFPKVRAKQLAQAKYALARVPLASRLAEGETPRLLRKHLIAEIPGLGPKQASMFLRNIGKSYDLAILDIHVLRFIDMQGLLPLEEARIGTVKGYEEAERIVIEYADSLGYPVGYLDWAIWATMKAAREIGL